MINKENHYELPIRVFINKHNLLTLCLLGFFICFISSFPGHTNFDEFNSLNEFFVGQLSDIQPPAHSIVWGSLIMLGRTIDLTPMWQASLLLITQLAIFWSCFFIFIKKFSNKNVALIFAIVICISPISILYLGHIGKDSQMAIAFFSSSILTWHAIQTRKIYALLPSIILLFYGFVIRSNAPAGGIVLIIYWSYGFVKNFNTDNPSRKVITSLSILLFIIFITLNHSISKHLIKNHCCNGIQLIMTPIQELMAISYEANTNLIPPEFYSDQNYSLDSIKKNFDPTYPYWDGLKVTNYEYLSPALRAWYKAVVKYPKIYITHKLNFLSKFYGFNSGDIPFSVFQGFYTNDTVGSSIEVKTIVKQVRNMPHFWLRIKNTFSKYFDKSKNSLCFRFWPYLALAVASVILLPKEKKYCNKLTVTLFMSAISYSIPYIVIASSVSIRYNLWPVLALTTIFFINLDSKFAKNGIID